MNLVYQLINRPLTNIVAIKRALTDLVYDSANNTEAINKGIIQIHNDSFSKKDFYDVLSVNYCNAIICGIENNCYHTYSNCRDCWITYIEKTKEEG